VVSHICEAARPRDAPLWEMSSGMYGPANMYTMKTIAMIVMGQPRARRVASSSSRMPQTVTPRSKGVGEPGRLASASASTKR